MRKKKALSSDIPLFRKTVLPNGVRVVSERIPSVRSVSVGVWVYNGSRDEKREVCGISHFIEHMVFKGTQKRRMHHIAQRMEAVGGYLNAFTGKEYTCYFSRSLDEHLDRAIDAVSDLVLRPTFPERELEKEKVVVLEEMKMYEDAPDDLIFDYYEATVYADDALGRPVIGYPETVMSFTTSALNDYLENHYTPNRMVVAIAGNVDHVAAVELVNRTFSDLRRPVRDISRPPVAEYRAGKMIKERPIQQAHLVVGTRTYGIMDERRTALNLLNTVLGGGMSSRLNQNIREKYGYCYNVYSFVNMMSDTGDFGVYMGTDVSKVDRANKLIMRELEKMARDPLSKSKLTQTKNQLKGSLMLGLENMSNRMMRIGRMELHFGQYFTLDDAIREIDSVTPEQVQAVAKDLYKPEQFSTVALVPAES